MLKSECVFDQAHYQRLNTARESVVRKAVARWKQDFPLETAIDIGCGVGHFSGLLASLGINCVGVDAREENVSEARVRFPEIQFHLMNAEDSSLRDLGSFDLVLCFGLLYHLENPFRVIRNIAAMTKKVAMIEGMVYPSPEPIFSLLDEDQLNDQGVSYVACYPTESCLAKMLYRSGFNDCWLPNPMPAHPNYQPQRNSFRIRSMLIASKIALPEESLEWYPHPEEGQHPWTMQPLYALRAFPPRIQALLRRYFYPPSRKARTNGKFAK